MAIKQLTQFDWNFIGEIIKNMVMWEDSIMKI